MSQSPAKTDDPATAFAARQFDSVEAHQDGVRTEATRVVQQPITAEASARWKAEADALPEGSVRYPGPWRVLLDEAYDVTRFVVQRWHPQTQPPFPAALPGLATVQARLPYAITADLVALAHLANEAQNLCVNGQLKLTHFGQLKLTHPGVVSRPSPRESSHLHLLHVGVTGRGQLDPPGHSSPPPRHAAGGHVATARGHRGPHCSSPPSPGETAPATRAPGPRVTITSAC